MRGVSFFIPVYNEAEIMEANLTRLAAFCQGLDRPFEIIVGSNGSIDASPAIGLRLSQEMAELTFFHLESRGAGLAFQEGTRRARYPIILTQDMDLSVDLGFIPQALELMADYDLVIGSKRMGAQRRSTLRVVASGAYIFCARLLLGLDYQDYSLAAKAFDKKLVDHFADWIGPGTDYVINLTYWGQRCGYRIKEIPVLCHDERASRFNLIEEGLSRFARLGRLWLLGRRRCPEPRKRKVERV